MRGQREGIMQERKRGKESVLRLERSRERLWEKAGERDRRAAKRGHKIECKERMRI